MLAQCLPREKGRTMQRNLTDRFIQSIKPVPGKRATVFDTKVTGLCVRVTDTGHRRFYVMSRDPAGRQMWAEVKDGNAPVTSLALARELAPAGVANIKNGKTAFPKIEAPAEVETYERVVARFIKQYAEPRQRTWRETQRVLSALPWGPRPITEIAKKDAIKYLNELVAADKRPTARITLAWLKTLWRWSWRQEILEIPVMDALKAEDFGIVTTPRKRVYSDDELKALWNAAGGLTSRERGFIKLVTLLGVRRGALLGMRKSELDDVEHPALWTIPTERVKTPKFREHLARVYLVPIPPLARRVLLPLLKGEGDLIFPAATRENVAMDCGSTLMVKVRKASGVKDWTAHPHRHTVTTWLQNEGHDEYDRGLILNHSSSGTVTGGYSHGYSLERTRELLDKWAGHVKGVVAGEDVELMA